MASSIFPPEGYWITETATGYALHSPYGLLGDDYPYSAAACFAAWEHAHGLADEADEMAAAEADDFPAIIELSRAA